MHVIYLIIAIIENSVGEIYKICILKYLKIFINEF